jgi:hypothetical protein
MSVVLHRWDLKDVGSWVIVGEKRGETPRLEGWLFLHETSSLIRRRSLRQTLETKLQDFQLRLYSDRGVYYAYSIFSMVN